MPAKANKVKVPVMPYYGDEEMTLDFPATWDMHCCQMKGWNAPRLTATQMRKAFANPIGTQTIREMAKGKKEVVILFDDLSRGTPADVIVPFVLE
jgi:nickel-dependent lactate racemase